MNTFLFIYIAICFGLVSLYFLWQFILYRDIRTLLWTVLPMGWVLVVARELKWWPRDWTTPLIAIALIVATFCVWAIYHHESQQPKPFR